MQSRGGTEGVGRSATSAVVISSLFLIVADVFLVRLIIVFYGLNALWKIRQLSTYCDSSSVQIIRQQKVLDGIDLTISRGQTVSLMGRSGTGKSVLLRLLIGLDQPDSGLNPHQRRGNHVAERTNSTRSGKSLASCFNKPPSTTP